MLQLAKRCPPWLCRFLCVHRKRLSHGEKTKLKLVLDSTKNKSTQGSKDGE